MVVPTELDKILNYLFLPNGRSAGAWLKIKLFFGGGEFKIDLFHNSQFVFENKINS